MKILLVGATGTLGRQIAKQAIEDGHEVRCFVRNPRKASFLQEWGCELTKGNLLNSSDIEYALQDIEVVIDAATSRPDDPKSIYEIDWDGKLNLFNACETLNVKRVVFLSILHTEKFRTFLNFSVRSIERNITLFTLRDSQALNKLSFPSQSIS